MKIIIGRSVKYFRQTNVGLALDPTMTHVADVRAHIKEILAHTTCQPEVEWLDIYTCRITLPEGWQWSE